MKGGKGKVKVAHRGGKSQDRGKGINRVGAEGETWRLWLWWRPVCNGGARAKGAVEGRANIGKVRGQEKGGEMAGLVGSQDGGRDRR